MVGITQWWGLHNGGDYTMEGITQWWGLHNGGDYTIVGITQWWGLHNGGDYTHVKNTYNENIENSSNTGQTAGDVPGVLIYKIYNSPFNQTL